jgi:hypothetical protein
MIASRCGECASRRADESVIDALIPMHRIQGERGRSVRRRGQSVGGLLGEEVGPIAGGEPRARGAAGGRRAGGQQGRQRDQEGQADRGQAPGRHGASYAQCEPIHARVAGRQTAL